MKQFVTRLKTTAFIAALLIQVLPFVAKAGICLDIFRNARLQSREILPELPLNDELTRLAIATVERGGPQDVTSERAEAKFTVKKEVVAKALEDLKKNLGLEDLKPREKQNQENKNIRNLTLTKYGAILTFLVETTDGKMVKRKLKIRIRQYLEENLDTGSISLNPQTDGKVWLEFKTDDLNREQDPRRDTSVRKPRILITRQDQELLFNHLLYEANPQAFLAKVDEISQRAKNEPVNFKDATTREKYNKVIEDVDTMLAFMKGLHKQRLMKVIAQDAQTSVYTSYGRTAYLVAIPNKDKTKKLFIQITIDQDVKFIDAKTSRVLREYGPNVRVVEVKIPIENSAITREDIIEWPGLLAVKALKETLEGKTKKGYQSGRGKLSHFLGDLEDTP